MKLKISFFILALFAALSAKEIPIVVVVPSYNNRNFYEKNLDSILNQKYENYSVIYVDDASPDGTGDLVREYIKKKGQEHRVTLIQNQERVGSLANLYTAISLCKPNEVVAQLDGDDWFYHDRVLQRVNEAYSDPDVWVTYGQFIHYPSNKIGFVHEVPEEIISANKFRRYQWTTSALRTFYAGLFHRIKKEDLLKGNSFYQMAGDLAYMFCVVEMAGFHSRFIPDILYVYNIGSPINDEKVDLMNQYHCELDIRAKKPYSPIERPY
jgi:glycosyltransferase involved in cell wall biosynthesis